MGEVMYFWRIEKLKEDIRANRLSEKDRFIYALIYFVLGAIVMELAMLMPLENGNIWDFINSFSNVLIVTFGTVFAFKANGSSKGIDFLGRYFSIGFVLAIRFLVYAIPLLIGLFVYYFFAYGEEEEIPTNIVDVVPFLIWYIAFYWRIYVHFKQVNS
jgi:hypothetical protein